MMTDSYDEVITALNEHDLSWSDIDRIHLEPEAYEDFQKRASFSPSNYSTTEKPAVRIAQETEILYPDESGRMKSIKL